MPIFDLTLDVEKTPPQTGHLLHEMGGKPFAQTNQTNLLSESSSELREKHYDPY